MDLLGVIAAEADPPGIDVERWRALMAEHAALDVDEDLSAHVVVEGLQLGRVCWSSTGANELDVYGEQAQVGETARQLAVALGARFVTLEELMTC